MLRKLFLMVIALISISYAFGLTAGDIAILGVNTDTTKSLAFVALVDIPASSTISFTDNAWNASTQAWRTGEGTIAWTNTSTVAKGTVVTITLGGTYSTDIGSVTTNSNFNLAAAGDQILAYDGSTAPTTNDSSLWLYGYSSANWAYNNNSNSSDIPTALSGANVALTSSTTDLDNGYFANGSTAQTSVSVTGTKAELLALFNNNTLYYTNNTGPLTFPTYTITVSGGSVATINVTGSLTSFSTITGTPSASQSYTLSGSNLTTNISVTPPAGFALSTNNLDFGPSLSLENTFNGLVYVRLTGTTVGSYSGNITHTSGTATQVDLAASGTVSDPAPTIHVTGTLTAFSTPQGTPSAVQTYTLYGSYLSAGISVTPPAGYELSTNGTAYSPTLSLESSFNGTVYVRLTGTTAGTYDGNIVHASTGATDVNLAATGTVSAPATPTTFLEENFMYTAGTTLVSNGWIAHNGAGSNSPIVHDTGLIYPDYPAAFGLSGKMLGNGEDVHKNFASEYTPATSGVVYASFLINVTNTTEAGGYLFHMNTNAATTTDFKARLHVGRDTSNNLRFGLTKSAATSASIPWTGYDYALNTTYLVVLKYEFVAGTTTNDIVTGWINPVIGATEPTPTLSAVVSETDIGTLGIGSVGIRQSSDEIKAIFDGIRVTNDWALLWSGEAPPDPEIIVTGTPDYLYSIAGSPTDPGEITSYNLSGANLNGPITVNAPQYFEVSTNGTDGWDDTIQVASTFDGSIYVRLNAPTANEYGGDISHTSSGADEVLLRVDGEAIAPDVVWNLTNNMVPFAGTVGEDSDIQYYSLSASNTVSDILVSVIDGPFEFSTSAEGPWSTSGSLPYNFNGNIYVKMLTTEAGSFEGSIKHTTTNASDLYVYPTGEVTPPAGNYAVDLFFSEYIEGSSNNKALEIFNGTGASVNLSGYKVELYANGAATATFTQVLPDVALAHGDVFVIGHQLANAAIQAQADLVLNGIVVNFNGDDAVALKTVSTDAYVDIFGVIDNDPDAAANNTGWTADGGYQTMNRTLVRKPTVAQGVTVNPPNPGDGVTTGFLTLGTEWNVFASDTIDYLGAHTFSPGTEEAVEPTILPAGGIKTSPVTVEMSSTTPDAVIYYTLDGSAPTSSSLNYNVTGSFQVSTTTTVKAITYAAGYSPSPVTMVEYIYPIVVNSIAALRAMPSGTGAIYHLSSEAILTFQQSTTRHPKYLQDATAAILIDDAPGVITTTYELYDGITGITGTLSLYSGVMLQFVPVLNTSPATSHNNEIVPEVRTLASLTSADQAKLIKVMNATMDATNVNFGTSAENINTTDATATLVMRTFGSTDYNSTPIPVDPVNITCLVGEFSTGMQISPRFLADFEAAGGELLPPQNVTISMEGTTVTIEWVAPDGATSYIVEVADDAYGEYSELTTTSNTSYSFTVGTSAQKFYRVRAVQ